MLDNINTLIPRLYTKDIIKFMKDFSQAHFLDMIVQQQQESQTGRILEDLKALVRDFLENTLEIGIQYITDQLYRVILPELKEDIKKKSEEFLSDGAFKGERIFTSRKHQKRLEQFLYAELERRIGDTYAFIKENIINVKEAEVSARYKALMRENQQDEAFKRDMEKFEKKKAK